MLLKEEVIRNLRSAQNIIRLKTEYGDARLEAACKRALFYGNYMYGSTKNIPELELDTYDDLPREQKKPLSSAYARTIDEIVNKEDTVYGNIRSN